MFKNKEYILAVYKEGGFTKAAEKLFISQPSLSASVKRIEEKIGSPIFDRSATPLTLTEAGREYIRCANEIERSEEDFAKQLSDLQNLTTGEIKIGGSSFFSSFILPHLISKFNETYEKIIFGIYEGNTKNLLAKLHGSEIDLVIDNATITDDNIISIPYISEKLLLAVPKNFRVNDKLSRFRMSAKDIKSEKHHKYPVAPILLFENEPFVLLNHDNDTGKRAEKLFKSEGINPKIIFRLEQQLSAYNISCTGMGISFVSDTLVKRTQSSDEVYYYNIQKEFGERNIYFYRRKNSYQSFACKKFIEYSTQNLLK